MPRNAGGTYTAPANTAAVSGATISSSAYNSLTGDIGSEITNSVDRLGRSAMQANLPMGGNLINNLGAPAVNTDAATKGYVDTGDANTLGFAAPPSAIMAFARNTAPTGWLAADGSAVSRTTYAALFAAIGSTFGAGDGSTTFNLPDMRGYFVRGAGTNGDGTAAGTFGAKQADAYLNHSHPITDKAHSHTLDVYNTGQGTSGTGGTVYFGNSRSTSSVFTGITSTDASTTGGTETRPKNIALLYCIKT